MGCITANGAACSATRLRAKTPPLHDNRNRHASQHLTHLATCNAHVAVVRHRLHSCSTAAAPTCFRPDTKVLCIPSRGGLLLTTRSLVARCSSKRSGVEPEELHGLTDEVLLEDVGDDLDSETDWDTQDEDHEAEPLPAAAVPADKAAARLQQVQAAILEVLGVEVTEVQLRSPGDRAMLVSIKPETFRRNLWMFVAKFDDLDMLRSWAVKKCAIFVRHPDTVHGKIQAIAAAYKLSEKQVCRLCHKHPNVLMFSSATIMKKLQQVQQLIGADTQQFKKILLHGSALTFVPRASSTMESKYHGLSTVFGTQQLTRVLCKAPLLLISSTDTLLQKRQQLQALLSISEAEVLKLINTYPGALMRSLQVFESRLGELSRALNVPIAFVKEMAAYQPDVVGRTTTLTVRKYTFLQQLVRQVPKWEQELREMRATHLAICVSLGPRTLIRLTYPDLVARSDNYQITTLLKTSNVRWQKMVDLHMYTEWYNENIDEFEARYNAAVGK